MFKLLLKKQFLELFRSYYVDPKTNTARSKAKTAGYFVLFAVLMAFLGLVFFGVADLSGSILLKLRLDWIFFAIMAILSIVMGTFGSVFNTFSTLYQSKDNDMMLSLPIPPRILLAVRLTVVYAMSLLYSGMVWLPVLLYHWIFGNVTALSVIFGVLLFFVIALFVTVLTCVLGWVVALVASRVKNKSIVTVVLSLVLFGLYYFLWFRMNDFFQTLGANGEKTGNILKKWLNLFYQIGNAAAGKADAMLIFTLVTAVLFALCFYVLTKTFLKILTHTTGAKTATVKSTATKSNNLKSALFKRELKRFLASPTYMLNCGLGILLLPVGAVVLLIKQNSLRAALSQMEAQGGGAFLKLIPFIILAVVCAVVSINGIATPSVSLEGKTFWILRSLPIPAADILKAKKDLHVRLNLLPALLTAIVACFCFDIDRALMIYIALFVFLFVEFTAVFGLMIGLLRPNFHWTNETTLIKQSLNVLIVWLTGWAIPIVIGVGYYFLRHIISVENYFYAVLILMAVGVRMLTRWLFTKGVAVFEKL